MKILVTGAKGFIGKNLIAELKNQKYYDIFEYDMDSTREELDEFCKNAEFVFHLAGINRPKDQKEFIEGNFGFTSIILERLKKYNNRSPIMLASSIQAEIDNPYGSSKKAGEDLLFNYSKETQTKVLIYRFPNIFGKWCKPNYNSVVATFSNNIAHDLPIYVNDPNVVMNLIYIDDLISELIRALNGNENRVKEYCFVEPLYKVKLGNIVDLLHSFKNYRELKYLPNTEDTFTKKLYSTYLSYLPKKKLIYELEMNIDHRGSFTEFLKTPDRGQVSINISKPEIVKGNHWHHTKNEKFLVVSGKGVIRLRKIDELEILEYYVSDKKLEVVDIPPGYTHNIQNLGNTDMVTIMWANEAFDPLKPDTFYLEV